ncbi:MAG: Gldg family protein [Proteobacteria bacterium]|nr:Gldg family protein [Pseudomonadota bacterium]
MKSNTTKLLILVAIFLFGSIIISQSGIFSHTRLDLTENKLFTLNAGTKNILKNIDEKIHLKLYFSDEATHNIPFLRTYKNTVLDLLNEMQRYANSKLEVSLVDPKIFSPEEDEASQFGLQALPVGDGGENIFFGLVGENTLDNYKVIPFIQPDREAFLEYDIAQLINILNNPDKKVIGIMSSINVQAKYDETKGEMSDPQVFVTQLQKDYTVRNLDINSEAIDKDIDVLMLVHPQNLSDKTLFAVDQFALQGGRLLVFVDPQANAQVVVPDPQNPMAAYETDRSSNLEKLFSAWNIKYDAKKVLLDEKYALNIQRSQGARPQRHLAYLAFDGDAFNKKDIITRDLNTVNLAISGYFAADNVQAFLSSSKTASISTAEALKFLIDPNTLFKNYQPDGKNYAIAGRVTGVINTAFPEAIAGVDKASIVLENAAPKIVVFADVDILFDQMWVKGQNFFGRKVFNAFADNGNMIVNLLDNMAGSTDLINIRGRKNSARPFTKVQELQKASDKKFREQENVLQQRLRETEQKLNQIQREKGQQDRLIMSQEQEQELKKFQQEKLEVRTKLREVRRNLDKDIQDLGSKLKIINIGLVPLIITLLGIFVLWFRPKRKGGKYAK